MVFAIGETVYDLIFRDGNLVAGRPGGAMLNSAVSLGRLNIPVCLVSEAGDDPLGGLITDFLASNNVDTRYFHRYPTGKTPVAVAFLDDKNEASYDFYKFFPPERLRWTSPEFTPGDFILFGSYFAINPEVRQGLTGLIGNASRAGSVILYDPNFRKAHLGQLESSRTMIRENIGYASLVRGSLDDFRFLFGTGNPDAVYACLREAGCSVMVCTDGPGKVFLRTEAISMFFDVPVIRTISTIGAGDTFNAGIIEGLAFRNISRELIPAIEEETWCQIVERAIAYATEVCRSYDNYLPARIP
ncbi:MAG: carbohydrate kinase [Bacteroidales bacterium]|nr:carbohydrate kinase [Bacteroidales bacterium]